MPYPEYPDWQTIRDSNSVRTRWFPMIDHEEPSFLGCPVAIDREDLAGSDAVIIGAPYAEGWVADYAGIPKADWLAAPKRVRQQSIRYPSADIQDFDIDVFEHLKVLDYGDADIPVEVHDRPTVENILRA
jgi:agmatinase